MQEIIRKLEAGDWRLKELKSNNAPITQIKPKSTASKKKAQCDISMENCPPSTVSSESDLASSASASASDVISMSFTCNFDIT